jgi:transaldolase
VRYVEELIGPHTVNTMPLETLAAFKDHGRVARTVDTPQAQADAQAVFRDLAAAGIDMHAVTEQLQKDGVRLFSESFDKLIATLEGRRQALARA